MLVKGLFILAALTTPIKEIGQSPEKLAISFDQAQELGNKIWKNECAGKFEGLTSWNEGEGFASLGIGHFIWYPARKKKIYQQTFPDLIVFLRSCGVTIPEWIDIEKGCPWRNRAHFLRNQESPKMEELRNLMYDTRALQAVYMAKRLEEVLPRLTANLELTEKKRVEKHFNALTKSSKGLYALIDYLNFKGEGTSVNEKYNNTGWGLLQVLQRIPANSIRPLDDFVAAARAVLAERVKNAPHEKNEQRWLKGWNNRLNTYLQ